MKFLTYLDEESAQQLELFNRLTGGRSGGGGNRSAIIRWLVKQHLPSPDEMKDGIKYQRLSGWQRQKVSKPEALPEVEEFREQK